MRTTNRRRRVALATAILLFIVLGPYAWYRVTAPRHRVKRFTTDALKAQPLVGEMSIVTYNIAHGRGPVDDNWQGTAAEKRQRIESIGLFLKQLDADIVVLNEADFDSTWSGRQNQAAAIAALAGYPYRVEQRNLDFGFIYGRWSFGNAVLSRFPITEAQKIALPPHKLWEHWLVGSKQASVCTINPPGFDPFRLVAVHLEHRDETTRVASVRRLIQLAEESSAPLVLAGDFNSSPSGFPFSQVATDGNNTMDLMLNSLQFDNRPATLPTASEFTFNSQAPDRVLDWIITPTEWPSSDYRVLKSDLSDHLPVYTTVRIPPAVSR